MIWLAILPFFILCWYAHPSADDFLQANDVSKHGHLGYFKYMYFHWTGRYAAMVGWSFFNPVSYGNDKAGYGLICLLMLVLLLVALVLLLRALLRGAGLNIQQLGLAGAAAMLLYVYQLPSTAECFYWLTSTFNYLMPGILLLLALTAFTRYVQTGPTPFRYRAAVAILLILVVGCNETIAVPIFLTVWFFGLLESSRQRRLVGWEIVLAVSVGCTVAFLAPGNTVRMQEEQVVSPGVFKSILLIINFVTYCLVNWLGNGILMVVTLLLVPAFARLAQLPELPLNRLIRYPILLTLLVPAFLAAGMLSVVWVSGHHPPPRALNLLYLCFLITWMLAAYAWVRHTVQKNGPAAVRLPAFVRCSLLAWLPFTLFTDYDHHLRDPGYRVSTNNTLLAYRDLFRGRAKRYNQQLTARYQHLRSTPTSDVRVDVLEDPPGIIFFSDIGENKDNWDNRAYAEFFRQKSITAKAAPSW